MLFLIYTPRRHKASVDSELCLSCLVLSCPLCLTACLSIYTLSPYLTDCPRRDKCRDAAMTSGAVVFDLSQPETIGAASSAGKRLCTVRLCTGRQTEKKTSHFQIRSTCLILLLKRQKEKTRQSSLLNQSVHNVVFYVRSLFSYCFRPSPFPFAVQAPSFLLLVQLSFVCVSFSFSLPSFPLFSCFSVFPNPGP